MEQLPSLVYSADYIHALYSNNFIRVKVTALESILMEIRSAFLTIARGTHGQWEISFVLFASKNTLWFISLQAKQAHTQFYSLHLISMIRPSKKYKTFTLYCNLLEYNASNNRVAKREHYAVLKTVAVFTLNSSCVCLVRRLCRRRI